jgi:hypothetical protein
VLITWTVPDPGSLGTSLADRLRLARPDVDADAVAYDLRGGVLRLVRPGPGAPQPIDERLEVSLAPVPAWSRDSTARIRLLGIGWATVELERAALVVGPALGVDSNAFMDTNDDAWLGARARLARGDDGVAMALLEPTTEGRLAAALARWGEGPIAIYLGVPGPAIGATRPGPFGASSIVHAARPWGPFVFAVAAAATIGP